MTSYWSDLGEIGFAGRCLVDDLTVKHDHETVSEFQKLVERQTRCRVSTGAKTRPQAGANVET
jgi:hypothetical protein